MQTVAGALITWKNGRPHFTAAGHGHYTAACEEVHIAFVPQALHSASDLRDFLRALLKASVALRKERASRAAAEVPSPSPMQSLARCALREVAQSAARSVTGSDESAHVSLLLSRGLDHHRAAAAASHY
ncbi:MAG: hypothetical protein U5L03_17345 [Burkholderiaceae bacterium]|nr:hypothetical protein [Burkholderiaceae bacterium]